MIRLKNICKNYGDKIVYENFNLDIEEKVCTVVLGESGSGKTTLMDILTNQTDYTGSIENMQTSLSAVFQSNVLVPNLTIEENIRLVNPNADVDNLLNSVGLLENKNDYPKSLSAGMKRRVAIIRALGCNSQMMLLDEPFINLDLSLKYHLMDIIKKSVKEKNQTLFMITHDIKEATYMADRIVVVSGGKIVYDIEKKDEQTENELFNLMLNLKKY